MKPVYSCGRAAAAFCQYSEQLYHKIQEQTIFGFSRVYPNFLGEGCLNQDLRDSWIYTIAGADFIPTREAISSRLKSGIAMGQ